MAIVQGTGSFVGIPINDARPGASRVRMLQQLKTIYQEQAELFERIVALKVPNASAIAATPHDHDGANSVVLPFPLAQGYLKAVMPAATATVNLYRPFVWQCIRVPPGIDQVRVSVFSDSIPNLLRANLQVGAHDSAMAYTAKNQAFNIVANVSDGGGGGNIGPELYTDVAVTAGAVNMIKIDCWDSRYRQGSDAGDLIALEERRVHSFKIRPIWSPYKVQPWLAPSFGASPVLVPDSVYHLGAHAFTSFPSEMFDDHRAVSSYLVTRMAANAALLSELLTGTPVSPNALGHSNYNEWAGHNHKNDAATSLEDGGELIEMPLGAFCYGCALAPPAAGGGHSTVDDAGFSWTGRIFGPALTASGSYETFGKHIIRLPDLKSADRSGVTTKIKGAVWLYNDYAKSGLANLRCAFSNSSGANTGGLTTTGLPASSGRHLVQWDNLEASTDANNEINLQQLNLLFLQTNAPNGDNNIYSSCFWIEP